MSLPLLWGIALGLALTHAFAFRLSARLLGGGRVGTADVSTTAAQLLGAASVALLASMAVVLAPEQYETETVMYALVVFLGLVGVGVGRSAGGSWLRSGLYGGGVALAALAVIAVKNLLAGH